MFGCVHSSGVDVWQCLLYSKQQSAQTLTVIRHSNLMSNNIKQLFFLGFDQEQFKFQQKIAISVSVQVIYLYDTGGPLFVGVFSGMITMILFSLEWHSLHLYYWWTAPPCGDAMLLSRTWNCYAYKTFK